MKIKLLILLLFTSVGVAFAQTDKPDFTLNGVIMLERSGTPVRNASVTIAELKRTTLSDDKGRYEFRQIPAGQYQLIVHLDRVADAVKIVDINKEKNVVDFKLAINAISENVTVTASGTLESTNNAYQSVTAIGSLKLAEENTLSIGEALDNQPGVAKRSFGPGAGRPVIRGFDGDRVLILQDGLRIGGIASASADEVEPIDALSLDRIEIVKGPATLLYGSNAIGGVVNGVSGNDVHQRGMSGYLGGFGGTTSDQAGVNGGFKYGTRNFLFFGNGGGQRAEDYHTPIGAVQNSLGRNMNAGGGVGWFPRKGWLLFDFTYDRRRHGIPGENDTQLKEHRNGYEIRGGLRELGHFIEGGDFAVSYNSYQSLDVLIENDEIEGVARNTNFNYRASFNQQRRGRLSGTFGVSGFRRDYQSTGAEAPVPRTRQNSFAAYALERIDFERVGFQFGGRIEQNGYKPTGGLPSSNFVGFSGGAGLRIHLWKGGSFVANYQHSFRAPALEELYNNGPHPGTQTYDIGNPHLKVETGDGVDISLRHTTDNFRLSGGAYYYSISNFVYAAFTGEVDPVSELRIIEYSQSKSSYFGVETAIEAKLIDSLWFNGKVDFVRAQLTDLNKHIPRIPPLRGTLGLDWRVKALSVRPELILTDRQDRVYDYETPTAGYAVFNLDASYTFFSHRVAHVISVSGYNLGNTLYRNHLSFIKDFAAETGRGVRLNYSMRF